MNFFGHEKGAFTGATSKRDGRFTLADGGTLFLDEIGELPLDLQSKLLRVLQEGEFDPVGSSQTRKVDVPRYRGNQSKPAPGSFSKGDFREDLYYRLSVFPIEIPSLRDRGEGHYLARFFFTNQCAKKMGKEIAPITEGIARRLLNYAWPGNIRELQNVVERAVITASNGHLNLDRALPETANAEAQQEVAEDIGKSSTVLTVQELHQIERKNIELALNLTKWRVAGKGGAADIMGMKPTDAQLSHKSVGH